jgi:hypothetical protein
MKTDITFSHSAYQSVRSCSKFRFQLVAATHLQYSRQHINSFLFRYTVYRNRSAYLPMLSTKVTTASAVKFTPAQATKAQRGSTDIALLCL